MPLPGPVSKAEIRSSPDQKVTLATPPTLSTARGAWSPEARAGTPLLPDLSPDAEPPVCLRTVRDGVTIFDALD